MQELNGCTVYISFQVKHLKVVLDFISNLVGIENVKRLMCISSNALNIDYTNSQVNDFLFLFFLCLLFN